MDMWRHHYARTDREETHPMHGDPFQTAPTLAEISGEASSTARQEWGQAPGSKSVQTGKCIRPPKLGKKQRNQEDSSSPIPHPDDGILGYSHLTLTRHLEHITHSYPLPLIAGSYWFLPSRSWASGHWWGQEGLMLTDVKGQWWLPQQYFCLFRLSCF